MPGCSAAWLARIVRDDEAASSNLATPTILNLAPNLTVLSFFPGGLPWLMKVVSLHDYSAAY
jgi:hypothetical protein